MVSVRTSDGSIIMSVRPKVLIVIENNQTPLLIRYTVKHAAEVMSE
jgi:hypothetical protein